MRGGVSHMESFDPKPMLTKYAGKSIGETPFKDVQSPEKLKKVRVVVVNDANGQSQFGKISLQDFTRTDKMPANNNIWWPESRKHGGIELLIRTRTKIRTRRSRRQRPFCRLELPHPGERQYPCIVRGYFRSA